MIQKIELRPDLVSDRQLAEKMNEIIQVVNEINKRTAYLATIGTVDPPIRSTYPETLTPKL